jgi:hypothetical protein
MVNSMWVKFELISGVAAGVLGIFLAIYLWNWPNKDFVFLFTSMPAIFAAYGACVHVMMRHNMGVLLLIPVGVFLCISFVINLMAGVRLFGPFIFVVLGTCLLGILCSLIALCRWLKSKSLI